MENKLKLSEFLHGGDYNPDQWLDHPEIIDRDFEYFKKANINEISLGIFSWPTLEPEEGTYNFEWLDDIFNRAEKQNIKIVLATPSGARPRWLADQYPEVLRTNSDGTKNIFGERHNHCYTSPIYRQKVQQINRKLAERYGKRDALILWHISNEFGGQCHCELCQQAFRDWLKTKYQTLDNLNHAYWSKFWAHSYTSWDQVHSPSPLGDSTFLGLNLDWRRFVSQQTINFFDNEAEPLRELTPNIPITTNFMGGNPPDSHVFYDLDYQAFAKHVDVVSWDSYPNWANDYESTATLGMKTALMNDVMRSLKHQNYLIMESTPSQVNWHPFNRAKRPGMHQMASLEQIAHGADSIMYFQLHQSRGASEMYHGAVISQELSDQTRVFKEVTEVGANLNQLKPALNTHHQVAKVAIVYDYDNMWALDDARAFANSTKKYWQTIQDHYQYFWEHDIPVELISVEDDFTNYDLVIDPMHFMMDPAFITKLKEYVAHGGHLVGTYISGMTDKNFLAYLGGWPTDLKSIYGLEVSEHDTLYPKQHNQLRAFGKTYEVSDYCDVLKLTTSESIGTYGTDFYADTTAVTSNNYQDGNTYYLGCRTDVDFLNDFYSRLSKDLSLQKTLPITKSSHEVSIQIRENDDMRYYFVINYGDQENSLDLNANLTSVLDNSIIKAGNYKLAPYAVHVYQETR
jgi:beta-galactosidase